MSTPNPVDMQTAIDAQHTMTQAANDLFENCEAAIIVLPISGKTVNIQAAKFKQINELVQFVTTFLSNLDQDKVMHLITRVSDFQEAAIKAGQDPYKLGTLSRIKDMVGDAGIIAEIMGNGLGELPKLVGMFSDLTADEFNDLELDEAFLVGLHILGRNYHFFIQRCAPVIRAFVMLLQSKGKKAGKRAQELNS